MRWLILLALCGSCADGTGGLCDRFWRTAMETRAAMTPDVDVRMPWERTGHEARPAPGCGCPWCRERK